MSRADIIAAIPTLPDRQVRKQRKRYWRWRLPGAVMTATRRPQACVDDPAFPDFAIAIIALRPRFQRWARVLIESLRAAGEYQGPIYVVTETPSAFVDLDNVATLRVPPTRHQMVAKSCKTFLCDWVPRRRILYVDADIVVGQPIKPWFDQAVSRQQDAPTLFYPDPGEERLPYHGGLMLMERTGSRALFTDWRQTFASGKFRRDQEALVSIADGHVIGEMPPGGILFPTDEAIEAGERACFVHITRNRYRLLGDQALRYYLEEILGVPDAGPRLDWS